VAVTEDFVVFIAGPDASERVEASSSLISARDRARRLARLLGVPLEDATAGLSAHTAAGRFRARALLRLAAYAAAPLVPAGRGGRVRGAGPQPARDLGPRDPRAVRHRAADRSRAPLALTRLTGDRDPAALLQLLRVLNTVDAERFPEIAADVDAAASRRAGLPPLAERDRAARLLAIKHLGRGAARPTAGWQRRRLRLDGVDPRFVPAIETIAGADAEEAWLAGTTSPTTTSSRRAVVYAVGPALADGRKIRFAIYRNGPLIEAQPVPVESRPDALAHTVVRPSRCASGRPGISARSASPTTSMPGGPSGRARAGCRRSCRARP